MTSRGSFRRSRPAERLRGQAARDLDGRRDGGRARRADAPLAGELRGPTPARPDEPPVSDEEPARPIERALAGDARAQQEREQLLVGQGSGPQAQEPLAGRSSQGRS